MNLKDDYIEELKEVEGLSVSVREKYLDLKRLLERVCKDITEGESLQFPSLFSRIVFIAQKLDLDKSLEWRLQNLRVQSNRLLRNENNVVTAKQYKQAYSTLSIFLAILNGEKELDTTPIEEEIIPENLPEDKIRAQVLDIDRENNILVCRSEYLTEELLSVRYGIPSINADFDETVSRLWIGAQLNLIDVKNDNGYYIPKKIILEPDYLIDASALAECFQSYGSSYLHYIRRKFEPIRNTHYILLGNLANFFLDELIYAADVETVRFEDIFLKSFIQMPFEYASCTDITGTDDFKDFMRRARIQFDNIRRVVMDDMPINGFEIKSCMLEPSFFCEKYGFQGRLDLLQLAENSSAPFRIIELKSGKPPYPRVDVSKIAHNHEAQTVVYRLMIETVFNREARQIYPTILYSSAENAGENVRLAAPYRKLENEILNIRNLIVATEHDLYIGNSNAVENIFSELLNLDKYGNNVPQFFVDKLQEIQKILGKASLVERRYFYRYVSFISRELYLQKAGNEGYETNTSVSALWNTSFAERRDALELIDGLEINEIDDSGHDMKITFLRRDNDDCINFRQGEICILYPRQDEDDSIMTNQILKGNVVDISSTHVILRFRYRQRNRAFFERYHYWVVEHDRLDHSYNAMFRGLFDFLTASERKKNLLLGLIKPQSRIEENKVKIENKTKEEAADNLIEKCLQAEDYFLIVGPPGTGKTSIFARRLIERFYADEETNILVIAYTNRAVDELCAAISDAFGEKEQECEKYIRVGTELSCGENYRHNLLQNISRGVKSRKELLGILNTRRIYVGTLASVTGKSELLAMKHFNVAIIDEASQILEPQIIGLLPLVDKFVMIGDHKQLSTISQQSEMNACVDDSVLNALEMYDCRESLFERLFRICKKNQWHHAYDTLVYHGRMHRDIASFVNTHFYEGVLVPATDRQKECLYYESYDERDFYESLVATNRKAFISIRQRADSPSDKMNEAEAEEITSLAIAVYRLYGKNKRNFDTQKVIGIITPYRNQIALIKEKLGGTGIAALSEIMVDTVERYQGSQRDVILFSFCLNKPHQLRAFSNMDREGRVDRKLNVALTRAREQLFVVGNEAILCRDPLYKELIEWMR